MGRGGVVFSFCTLTLGRNIPFHFHFFLFHLLRVVSFLTLYFHLGKGGEDWLVLKQQTVVHTDPSRPYKFAPSLNWGRASINISVSFLLALNRISFFWLYRLAAINSLSTTLLSILYNKFSSTRIGCSWTSLSTTISSFSYWSGWSSRRSSSRSSQCIIYR